MAFNWVMEVKGKQRQSWSICPKKRQKWSKRSLKILLKTTTKLLEEKLHTEGGKRSDPKTLTAWTNNVSDIPEFTFGDLYSYLVGSEEYSEENLRSFKSLLGYKLYRDGHVTDLKCCPVENRKFFFFKFKVKPTERAKTEDGQTTCTYNGFITLKASGEVHCAHCPCKGGSDGCCRHIAAVLFDLQVTISNNMMSTCTSGKWEWKRRSGNSDYATPLKDLRIVKAEFGKSEKNPIKPHDFDPGPSSFDPVLIN